MKPAGRSLPITPHHNLGVTWFTDTKIPQYRKSAVVRIRIQAAKPGRRICYDDMNISLNTWKINIKLLDVLFYNGGYKTQINFLTQYKRCKNSPPALIPTKLCVLEGTPSAHMKSTLAGDQRQRARENTN
ncbi:hypothetical protein [Escherichia coli]|uniref:Uncharacterized protein n=1 Tax=Escherichia coli TaxID=562 RepID=A0A8E2GZ73_ECOLX|nr:hypothetical protein [Escherichia coli]MBV0743824.1 hypothetical protein [Escherichia coli]OJR55047.1 hypothetical protein BK383_10785 [Escherichia coli]HDK9989273.1 hypothetical protein [Escherichia coli]HDP7022649.1 hypothetical protein [Escherichia coli]